MSGLTHGCRGTALYRRLWLPHALYADQSKGGAATESILIDLRGVGWSLAKKGGRPITIH
jgi:hypothetical protein